MLRYVSIDRYAKNRITAITSAFWIIGSFSNCTLSLRCSDFAGFIAVSLNKINDVHKIISPTLIFAAISVVWIVNPLPLRRQRTVPKVSMIPVNINLGIL